MHVENDVTLGMGIHDAQTAMIALGAVLAGTAVPEKIRLLMVGEFPEVDQPILNELISGLINIRGCQVHIRRCKGYSVRDMRNTHLDLCGTKYLWMLDDDVIPTCDCLLNLMRATYGLVQRQPDWIWLNGIKVDTSNRRGYKDYSTKRMLARTPKEPWCDQGAYSPNHLHFVQVETDESVRPCLRADAGNALIHIEEVRKHSLNFSTDGAEENAGGEDFAFGEKVRKLNPARFLIHLLAEAYHLPKPQPLFNEFTNRKEVERLYAKTINNA